MSDSDEIKLTRKDWHLLKMVFRNINWGKVDRVEAWKKFVDSVESRFEIASDEATESRGTE